MTTALLIVDMQNDFVDPDSPFCIAGARATVPHLSRLLAEARMRGWVVVHVVREHRVDGTDVEWPRREGFLAAGGYAIPGTRGVRIIEELTPVSGEYRIVKPRFSGFMQTNLDAVLRRRGVERVVVCGTQYPNCLRATAFDALALDYRVVVALEATSAKTPEVAAANISDLEAVGIPCRPIDEILASTPGV
jgi:nicotinamidase-related amidase